MGELQQQLLDRTGSVVLQQLITERLVRQEAAKRQVSVAPAEIDQEIEKWRARYPSPDDFDKMLKQSGVDIRRYRKSVEINLLIDKMSLQDVHVTDEDIEQYYRQHAQEFAVPEQVRVRDMLFNTKENAVEVLKALKAGGDFANLARDMSQDPATKDRGGDMGLMPVDSLADFIRQTVKRMEPGNFSGVVQGPDGWYLLRLEERVDARQRDLKECKDEIRKKITDQRHQVVKAQFLTKLESAAKVTCAEPSLCPAKWRDRASTESKSEKTQ